MQSPLEVVKEVAKRLEQNSVCYVNRSSREITEISLEDTPSPESEEQLKSLEKNIARYIKVKPMSTQTLIFAMKDFLLEVTDQDVERELSASLKRKNPTRNFLQIIESRFDIKQHWTLFKAEKYEEYVEGQFIDAYNY